MAVDPAFLASLAPTGCSISIDAQVLERGLDRVLASWDTGGGTITIRNAAVIQERTLTQIARVFAHRVHFEF